MCRLIFRFKIAINGIKSRLESRRNNILTAHYALIQWEHLLSEIWNGNNQYIITNRGIEAWGDLVDCEKLNCITSSFTAKTPYSWFHEWNSTKPVADIIRFSAVNPATPTHYTPNKPARQDKVKLMGNIEPPLQEKQEKHQQDTGKPWVSLTRTWREGFHLDEANQLKSGTK